jgi:hypothetical protein
VTRGIEAEILPAVRELGISVTAYAVLSRVLLSGSRSTGPRDLRAHLPRFTDKNYERNQKVFATLREIAADKSATPSQIAIAWVLSRGIDIVPLVGARRRPQLKDALRGLELKLSPQELAELEAAISPDTVAGTRYDENQMQWGWTANEKPPNALTLCILFTVRKFTISAHEVIVRLGSSQRRSEVVLFCAYEKRENAFYVIATSHHPDGGTSRPTAESCNLGQT